MNTLQYIAILLASFLLCPVLAQNERDFIKVNCGGAELRDIGFLADEPYFYADSLVPTDAYEEVLAPVVPLNWGEVYRTHRYAVGGILTYRFPVPAGVYSVGLMFVEQYEGAAVTGGRVMDLYINGVPLDTGIDVWTLAGEKLFEPIFIKKLGISSLDGYITIGLVPVVENPMLSGIVIEGPDAASILWQTTAPSGMNPLEPTSIEPTPVEVTTITPAPVEPTPVEATVVETTPVAPTPVGETQVEEPAEELTSDTATDGAFKATLNMPGTGVWRNEEYLSGAPIPRHESCAVFANGLVYSIGGRGSKPMSVYDPISGTWAVKEGPQVEINHMQCVYYNNRIYIAGAWYGPYPTEKAHEETWVYDIPTETWLTLPGLPPERRRGGGAFVLYNDKLYLSHGTIGGHGAQATATGYLDVFDPLTNVWTPLPDGPLPRDHTAGAVINGKLCVIGGRDGGVADFWSANVGPVVCYTFETMTWEVKASLPVPRGGAMVGTTCGGLIMVAGGEGKNAENPHGRAFDRVDFYHEATDTFLSPSYMTSQRHASGLAITSCECGNIFVPSGSAGLGGGPEVSTTDVWSMDGVPRRCI